MKYLLILLIIITATSGYNSGQGIKNDRSQENSNPDTTSIRLTPLTFPSQKRFEQDDFKKGVIFSPAQLIQGKVAGLTIMNMTGNDQNPRMQFHFRGASTMFYETDPLYVINGIPVTNVDFIMPENIESIEVAGNLSEAAGYGIRGSNGVIRINTLKKGKEKFALSYSNCFFIERMSKKSDYLSPSEFRQIKNLWGSRPTVNDAAAYYSRSLDDYNSSTDWINEITQKKISQHHNLSLNGNHKNTAYSLSLSYRNYHGVIKRNESDIYSGQFSLSQYLFKNRVSMNFATIWSVKEFSDYNTNPLLNDRYPPNIFVYASRYNPTVTVYDSIGDYTIPVLNGYRTPNPLSRLFYASDSRKTRNILTSINAGYKIIDGLEFSASFARIEMNKEFFFSRTYSIDNGIINDEINETQNYDQNFLKSNLSYIKKLRNHHVELLMSFSVEDFSYEKAFASNLSWSPDPEMVGGYHRIIPDKTRQIFVNAGYAFRNKYLISAGILSERAAIFPIKPSTHHFPSYKAGWILSNEKFMGDPEWIDYFELFTEYGKSRRNVNLTNYDYRDLVGDEILKESIFGMKLILLDESVSLLIERYSKITNDGIWVETIPFPNQIFKSNAMEIRNSGWEFSARLIPIRKEEFRWISDFNLSVNKNRVLSDIITNSLADRFDQPVGMIIGNRFAGFDSEDRMLVYDSAGNPVFAADYEYLENSIPTLYFGFTNNFVFKNFDFSFFLRGASGHYIHDISRYELPRGFNITKDLITADMRFIKYGNARPNMDYLLEKGRFMKVDNVMLGYTIYPELWKINKLRLFVACNNLGTLTKFSGWDPEMVPISGEKVGRYYADPYPVTRIYSAGLKIEL